MAKIKDKVKDDTVRVISVRIDKDLAEKLDKVSTGTKMSKAMLINALLKRFFSMSDEERADILYAYLGQGSRAQ